VFGNLRWSRCGADAEARRLYQAQLCASCHAMHGLSGRASSLLANYDQSLLVLVLSALAGGEPEPRRCTAVPWRTVAVQQLPAALQTFVAAGNLALIDAKLRDDVDDGGRWYARPLRWLLGRKVQKALQALRELGFDVARVTGLPARQAQAERGDGHDLGGFAEPSADLLGEIFAHGARLGGAAEREPDVRRFGAAVARAVYGLDALEDHDEDRRRGRFNAIARTAARLGHGAAVQAAAASVQGAAIEAQQLATRLLPEDRQRMVGEILQQLVRRSDTCRDRLLGRPEVAAARPSEAGDCDCACEGCGGGEVCCAGEGCCFACECCDVCFCWSEERRQRRRDRRK
jgi:hypothetical protein